MPVRVFKVENMRHEVLRRLNLCGNDNDFKAQEGPSRTYRIRGKSKGVNKTVQSPKTLFQNGDLVWFDPGVAGNDYVLPGEVVEFHRAGQVVTVQAVINGKGDLVWFDPGVAGNDYVLPGEVVEFHRAGQVVTVQAVINGKPQTFTLSNLSSVRRRQDLGQNGVEDMIQLIDLNEASLLWNLKIRYDKEFIYTYVGSILVAVNPYKMFDIYGLDIVKKYEGQILGTLPPHLFAIGSSAYSRISKDGENQVVIISGESGAGKTESTKLIMQYLAAVNKSSSNLITEQILEASPLLESFGNAKTVRNDNSSRFGKYLDVHFKDGVITGAKTTEYLLEKSRIVTHSQDERNYHVFYEMLSGLSKDDREKYGLQTADKYFYLNQGGSCEIQCKYDGEDFQALLSAMQVLGFTSEEQETIWRILSSILHLGNVYFHKKHLKYGQEGVEIGSDTEIRWAAHLLQINAEGIIHALTTKTTEARNERVFTTLNIDQALDARDAVAKALYSRLFSWLVQRINNIVFKETKKTSIAILDIFGFEDFKENSFEQLCINYANEMLQLHFNKHIFKLEQQEYAKEKIDWQTITFQDNQPVINLISKKPIGVLHVLDDESNFPKATDHSFLEKCHYNHALNDLYSRPRMSSMEFGIKHYAGQVWYSVDGFLDKNRDTLRWDVVELLIGSKLTMISEMFTELRSGAEAAKTINKANGRFVTMKPRTPTVAARFNDSLSQLVETMSECNPWFVRCLKPNSEKTPMKFDMPVVLEQLRYSGMMETIRIRKTGYPIRLKFAQFAERYRCLVPGKIPKGAPAREICRVLLDQINANRDNYQLGTTKVFMRETMEQQIERQRVEIVRRAAVIIQKYVRRRIARKQYLTMRRNTIVIQSHVRGWLARKEYVRKRSAVIRMQSQYRMSKQRRQYLQIQENRKARNDAEKLARERARAKAQQEEKERVSHAVAGVNHLEIPAELAFIFSKLDDWQSPHNDRNIIKVVGNIPESQDHFHLPKDIDQHVFNKFTNIYFKNHIWGMKRDAIKTPFLAKNKDIDYQESLSIFKLILRFMNDNNLTGKKETVLGDYIVQKALMNEKMRNEILCQLCNQTWKNDNEANNERGWVLIANCLSCFAPDKTLYKYLLKYVSDHAYDGYKAVCQKKLLQSENIEPLLARTYPPCLLEWKANIKRTNMALEVMYPDGESIYGPIESWSTGEDFAAQLLRRRGISECRGWSVSLNEMHTMYELNGTDYVLDLISELEIPPAFPVCSSFFLTSTDPRHRQSMGTKKTSSPHNPNILRTVSVEIEEFTSPSSMPARSQPVGRISRERILEKQNKSKQRARSLSGERDEGDPHYKEGQPKAPTAMERFGLSKSKLNDRYHSMENLVDNANERGSKVKSWDDVGLATSALNDRYFQQEHAHGVKDNGLGDVGLATSALNDRYFQKGQKRANKDSSSSNSPSPLHGRVSEIKKNLRNEFKEKPLNGHSNSDHMESSSSPEMPHRNGMDSPDYDFEELVPNRPDSRSRGSSVNGNRNPANRYVKSQTPIKSPSADPMQSTQATSKSSALSDTSEAPSLASQFRKIPVPSQTGSDLDKYLDDLFNPVLEGNLDELSDARSLAASIKGGRSNECETVEQYLLSLYDDSNSNLTTLHEAADLSRMLKGGGDSQRRGVLSDTRDGNNVDNYITELFKPIFVDHNLDNLGKTTNLANQIKGGGQGGVDTQQNPVLQPNASFSYPMSGMMSPPPPSMSGMLSPPPAMMPSMALGANPLLGGVPVMPTVPGMNSTLPLYTLGGFNVPMMNPMNPTTAMMDPSQIALQQQMLQQQALQLNAVSSHMQQMQQRAFLASAVQQNLQLQQHLAQQNQALQQLIQQQQQQPQQQPGVQNMGAAARTSTPILMQSPPPEPPTHRSSTASAFRQSEHRVEQETRVHHTPGSKFRKNKHLDLKNVEMRNQKVNFQDPDRSWSDSSSPQSAGPSKPFADRMPPFQDRSPSQFPANGNTAWYNSPPPMKISNAAYGEVMNELKTKRNSIDSATSTPQVSRGRPPPPPPPLPPSPPEATHPFVDVFGRAKTVRIGKWRWPPAKSDDDNPGGTPGRPSPGRLMDEDDLYKPTKSPSPLRDVSSGSRGHLTSESSSSDLADKTPSPSSSKEPVTKAYDNREPRKSEGSVGKLKISSDIRAKLEAVTLNHSVRSITNHKSDARNVYKEVTKLKNQAKDDDEYRVIRKLGESRKNDLQMKLTNRGMDQVDSKANGVRNPPPPPPPVGPLGFHIPPPPPPSSTYEDGSSYYGQTGTMEQETKSPPRPISPSGNRIREIVKTRSENLSMDRIEIIESADFLKPVDVSPRIMDESDMKQLESIRTKIYQMTTAPYCTYARVPWTLQIRKEVFTPAEHLSNPLALHLIFCQVVSDTYSKACIRINTENRQKMRHMLDNYGITPNNLHSPHHKVTVKKNVVDIAREWQTYFCRLFPINGGQQYPEAHYLGISHTGVLLVQREREPADNLRVLHIFSLDEVVDAIVPHGSTLQVIMRNGGRITLFTHKANQIRLMLDQYCVEAETGGHEYVRAVADYITRESTLLSFRRGEIIRLIHKNQYLEKGWLYGEVGGRTGIFPCEYVVPLSRNELSEMTKQEGRYDRLAASVQSGGHFTKHHAGTTAVSSTMETRIHESRMQNTTTTTTTKSSRILSSENREIHGSREALNTSAHWTESRADYPDDKSDISQMTTSVNDGRHSLLQFALAHFRQSLDNYEMLRTADGSIRGSLKMIESLKAKKKGKKSKDSDWTWKEQVEMVKYTKSPIQASLLKLETPDLNKLALECFIGIMRFMGDYPMATDQSDVDCVYTVLINCHKHPPLRDEVYCQIMKQTTNNKSTKADSCQRGWRLFSIIAAYFQSSELLKPYLFKYLETAAYDKRRAYHGTALVCLQNLRKTFKYGGRKNVPSIEEIAAISAGRNSKRQIYRLPGGTERVINTKSTSAVQDIIEEICSILNVRNQHEMEEFSLYCIVEGDTFTMPLAREEYILDVTTELQRNQQVFYLIFCRSVWYYSLRLDNQLYIEVVFNQIAPDYLEGLLLVMPGGQLNQEAIYDLARVAALLHRAAQMETMPTLKETKYLLPKPILTIRDIKPPQWVNMVQSAWKDIERINATDAKAQVLETLQKWPLFGSSFFAIKKLSDKEKRDFILALNRNGVHFLDVITHETLQRYPFSEVISTRKVRAEEGTLYLDMKCGNLMVQKITRIQTDQAHEISRLIRQYITIEQRNQGLVQGDQASDIMLPR